MRVIEIPTTLVTRPSTHTEANPLTPPIDPLLLEEWRSHNPDIGTPLDMRHLKLVVDNTKDRTKAILTGESIGGSQVEYHNPDPDLDPQVSTTQIAIFAVAAIGLVVEQNTGLLSETLRGQDTVMACGEWVLSVMAHFVEAVDIARDKVGI